MLKNIVTLKSMSGVTQSFEMAQFEFFIGVPL